MARASVSATNAAASDGGSGAGKVMANLHLALATAGANIHDVVMPTILLVEGVDLTAAYPVAAAALAGAAPPVVVMRGAGLAVPGALVEVSAVAALSP
jgi:enamine deaminase RidA (YjgF/YER057c/UK114 family)